MTSDPRSIALADLRKAILALAPRLQGTDDLADLSQLQAATDRLSQRARPAASGLRDYDPQRFQRLLELTGPRMAGTLLAHLVDDLSNCRTIMLAGADPADWTALREGTHVLISLAGSVGALSLQALAETLNAAAHRQDSSTVKALVPDLLAELEALIDLVRATPAPAKIRS
ncbi:Hpt domain-containing protein [Tabrizicola sp.]|uniref:Hpt domain-containing protein n=1 Tax=Tabrizicola sp. TaxID=2005166 RepID=UPI00262D4233|nr:Hpt domain-containing protein [Tabrizicola sp.]MDM7932982.1 hypothetical protein [Tabrizicola sp.]